MALVAVVAVAATVLAGCGSGGSGRSEVGDRSTVGDDPALVVFGLAGAARDGSSPFTIYPTSIPEGWALTGAGQGQDRRYPGDDVVHADEPYTVLGRTDDREAAGISVVSTGHEDVPDGLARASLGFQRGADAFQVDGRDAMWWSGGPQVLLSGADDGKPDAAVFGPGTRDELLAIAEATVQAPGSDGGLPPTAPEPPAGFEVLGQVDADVVVAARETTSIPTELPGLPTAHAATFARDGDGRATLSVLTLPGGTADLDALAAFDPLGHERRGRDRPDRVVRTEVAGRPAVFSSLGGDGGTKLLLAGTPWGDVLVVRASGGDLTDEDLVALASGVTEADDAAWERFQAEAGATGEFGPDVGWIEVARGTIGDREWLLQVEAGLEGEALDTQEPEGCLELSDGSRPCGSGAGGGPDGTVWTHDVGDTAAGDAEVPRYLVVTTSIEAAAVRFVDGAESVETELHPLPGGTRWSGVVFTDLDAGFGCAAPGDEPGPVRTEALDAAGIVIACIA